MGLRNSARIKVTSFVISPHCLFPLTPLCLGIGYRAINYVIALRRHMLLFVETFLSTFSIFFLVVLQIFKQFLEFFELSFIVFSSSLDESWDLPKHLDVGSEG